MKYKNIMYVITSNSTIITGGGWIYNCKILDKSFEIVNPFNYTVGSAYKKLIFKSDHEFLLKLLKS